MTFKERIRGKLDSVATTDFDVKLLAERTARQKLVGTYPPKKLNY